MPTTDRTHIATLTEKGREHLTSLRNLGADEDARLGEAVLLAKTNVPAEWVILLAMLHAGGALPPIDRLADLASYAGAMIDSHDCCIQDGDDERRALIARLTEALTPDRIAP